MAVRWRSVDGTADVMPHSSMFDEIAALKQSLANAVDFNAFRPIPLPTTNYDYQIAQNKILSGSRAAHGYARHDSM